ncbi:FtsX-like permease family protein [Oleiagrimonas sp. C23AA]|uniref:ABC transporter permease n=1 Tax=Oleiagrimonas sp. C23AA TaxID=2719047 RepID=UPI00141E7351|nr:FtsX-like permease family protein [Oleiagrimonas sp. C23AA]NII12032.1 FtsX-like permease family protein [Oleiagrimonas sp. C23AA]
MNIRPILASLRKHRLPVFLLVLEIALACAVLCNAVSMIATRWSDLGVNSGIEEPGLSLVTVNGNDGDRAAADIPRNLAALHGIGGVRSAGMITGVPLSNSMWVTATGTTPFDSTDMRQKASSTAVYIAGRGALDTLGVRLVAGRLFRDEDYIGAGIRSDYQSQASVVLISQSFAQTLWPGQSALGKTIYSLGHTHYTVVGVLADLAAPSLSGLGPNTRYHTIVFPGAPNSEFDTYLIRSRPNEQARVMREAMATLQRLQPQAVISAKTYAKVRAGYFDDARNMIAMLVLVAAIMLAVTAVGIIGLSSFWVSQRRRQIGVRRALGARAIDILRYFQTENLLLSCGGIVLGMAAAYGINLWLTMHYDVPRMPWFYLPVGAIALALLGQLAVLGPALRASRVPPVVATRSV